MIFNFCFTNKIKLVFSAIFVSLGNNGEDKNLSPYAFMKSKNLNYYKIIINGLVLILK